jgi:hypothetical protein
MGRLRRKRSLNRSNRADAEGIVATARASSAWYRPSNPRLGWKCLPSKLLPGTFPRRSHPLKQGGRHPPPVGGSQRPQAVHPRSAVDPISGSSGRTPQVTLSSNRFSFGYETGASRTSPSYGVVRLHVRINAANSTGRLDVGPCELRPMPIVTIHVGSVAPPSWGRRRGPTDHIIASGQKGDQGRSAATRSQVLPPS